MFFLNLKDQLLLLRRDPDIKDSSVEQISPKSEAGETPNIVTGEILSSAGCSKQGEMNHSGKREQSLDSVEVELSGSESEENQADSRSIMAIEFNEKRSLIPGSSIRDFSHQNPNYFCDVGNNHKLSNVFFNKSRPEDRQIQQQHRVVSPIKLIRAGTPKSLQTFDVVAKSESRTT